MLDQEKFREFLKERPSISLQKLEREAGVPRQTLSHFLSGSRGIRRVKYLKLLNCCKRYSLDPWMVQEATLIFKSLSLSQYRQFFYKEGKSTG